MATAKISQAVRSARVIASKPVPDHLLLEVAYDQAFDEWQSFGLALEARVNAGEDLFAEDIMMLTALRERVIEIAQLRSRSKGP